MAIPALGETRLLALIASLKPVLASDTFVFITLPTAEAPPSSLHTLMTFREAEGLTIITTEEQASSHSLEYTFPCRMITLDIHSSLEAVGFMAAVSMRLAEKGIGCNPVSGFFHDHCFVPLGKALEAMDVLQGMAEDAKKTKKT